METPTEPKAGIVLRIAAIVASVIVLLVGIVISAGAVLLVPIGMWMQGKFLRRRGRAPGRGASWMAASTSALVGLIAIVGLFATQMPAGTSRSIKAAMDSSKVASTNKPVPAWMDRFSPEASAQSERMERASTGLAILGLFLGGGLALMLFAAFFGSIGWVGAALWRFGRRGTWPAGPVEPMVLMG